MKGFALVIAVVQGLAVTGLLFLIQAVVQSFQPSWVMPFSPWWGMIFCLPGLAMAFMFGRERL